MAQIKGTNVAAPVVPFDTTDVHPSHEARYGRGGYRTVATTAERDAIPAARREAGMLVFVTADGKVYKLLSDLTSWEEFKSGASTWSELDGKPATFPPSTHTHTASQITDFTAAVIAAAPPTTNASLLTSGTLPDARLSSNIARTSDVSSAVAAVVNAAPATLDTLTELADALGSDANFSTTVTNALAAKAPIASPTFTGTVSGITKSMVGLGNVDNTSDASKPVSTAQAAADAAVASAAASDATTKANAAQSAAVQRANHTGTQTASTISDFSTAAAAAAPVQSVAGRTGAVTIAAADVSGLGSLATQSSVSYASLTGTPSSFAPSAHKTSHSTGGSDAIAPADIGAASASHAHTAADTTSGVFDVARLPVGQTSTTVAAGNDARFTDARTPLAHVHSGADITSGSVAAARLGQHASTHQTGGSDAVTNVVVSPSQITGNQNDYSPGTGDIVRLSSDAARNITGVTAGASGEVRVLVNVGSHTITLVHQSASSTAANRFLVSFAADYLLAANAAAVIVYDGTTSRWRVI